MVDIKDGKNSLGHLVFLVVDIKDGMGKIQQVTVFLPCAGMKGLYATFKYFVQPYFE